MRVDAVQLQRVQIPLRRAFRHALHERRHTDATFVSIHGDDGSVGWGEILPRPYVTGETMDEVLTTLAPRLADALVGQSFPGFDAATQWLDGMAAELGQKLATLCGFDLALLDLVGRSTGQPIASVLGGAPASQLPAGVIIGFEHATSKLARYCAALRLGGKTHVKVKVGLEDDLERLEAVVKVFKTLPLRLDANAAWTVEEAIERLEAMKSVAVIESIEQPIAADDLDGLRRIHEATDIEVMADESVCSLADAERIIAAEAASIFNIRLGKNGGFWAAHRLCRRAREAGISIHLGTMVGESGVLSRAGEIFGRCEPGFACLDGKGQNAFLLEVDILSESGEHPAETKVAEIDVGAPGLGVEISQARMEAHRIGDIQRFDQSVTEKA